MPRVIVDTREQNPFAIHRLTSKEGVPVETVRGTLLVGDYSLDLPSPQAGAAWWYAIERKSKPDLFSTLTTGRKRFQREVERAAEKRIRLDVVIEATFEELFTSPPPSTVEPLTILRTIQSWSIRYGMHWWMPGAARAPAWSLRLLEWSWLNQDEITQSGEWEQDQ